jgi:hypothetical protein
MEKNLVNVNVRKIDSSLKSFGNSLTDNDLHFFCSRLFWRYQDDLAHVFNYITELKQNNMLDHADIDQLLYSSKTSEEFHKNLDSLTKSCLKEYERRGYKMEQLA